MARCLYPYKTPAGDIVPCCYCANCKATKVSNWSVRLMQECRAAKRGYFVTLTYRNISVPRSKNKFKTLKKRDLQLFLKRLKKNERNIKISYYACGEYGGQTFRPHYHLLLFNARIETIQKAWRKGHIYFGTVTEESCGYVLKYLSKDSQVPKFKNDDRLREFTLSSHKLGLNYCTPQMINWHRSDLLKRMYIPLYGALKVPMPKVYKKIIYSDAERRQIGLYLADQEEKNYLSLNDEERVAFNIEKQNILIERQRRSTSSAIKKINLL